MLGGVGVESLCLEGVLWADQFFLASHGDATHGIADIDWILKSICDDHTALVENVVGRIVIDPPDAHLIELCMGLGLGDELHAVGKLVYIKDGVGVPDVEPLEHLLQNGVPFHGNKGHVLEDYVGGIGVRVLGDGKRDGTGVDGDVAHGLGLLLLLCDWDGLDGVFIFLFAHFLHSSIFCAIFSSFTSNVMSVLTQLITSSSCSDSSFSNI